MNQIPVYLKTSQDTPRPADPEFYWITQDGTFLGRNHRFFTSDVPAPRAPRSLAEHQTFAFDDWSAGYYRSPVLTGTRSGGEQIPARRTGGRFPAATSALPRSGRPP